MSVYTQNNDDRVLYPLPPKPSVEVNVIRSEDMAVYARFMRHLRHVPNSRTEIKVLSSIQFTADMIGYSDAHVSKILVDLGLRAPRAAFPAAYLEFADAALMRTGWDIGGPTQGLIALQEHWHKIGEDKFAAARKGYDLFEEENATF